MVSSRRKRKCDEITTSQYKFECAANETPGQPNENHTLSTRRSLFLPEQYVNLNGTNSTARIYVLNSSTVNVSCDIFDRSCAIQQEPKDDKKYAVTTFKLCCVHGCSEPGKFPIPRIKRTRTKWLNLIRWLPSKPPDPSALICPHHFVSSDFYTPPLKGTDTKKTVRLKTGAVPTVFEWEKLSDPSEAVFEKVLFETRNLVKTEEIEGANKQKIGKYIISEDKDSEQPMRNQLVRDHSHLSESVKKIIKERVSSALKELQTSGKPVRIATSYGQLEISNETRGHQKPKDKCTTFIFSECSVTGAQTAITVPLTEESSVKRCGGSSASTSESVFSDINAVSKKSEVDRSRSSDLVVERGAQVSCSGNQRCESLNNIEICDDFKRSNKYQIVVAMPSENKLKSTKTLCNKNTKPCKFVEAEAEYGGLDGINHSYSLGIVKSSDRHTNQDILVKDFGCQITRDCGEIIERATDISSNHYTLPNSPSRVKSSDKQVTSFEIIDSDDESLDLRVENHDFTGIRSDLLDFSEDEMVEENGIPSNHYGIVV